MPNAGKRYADSRGPQRLRLQAANSTETINSKEGGRASSDVGGWGPERSRASQAESELGSIVSAPDMYPEDSGLIEELVVRTLQSLWHAFLSRCLSWCGEGGRGGADSLRVSRTLGDLSGFSTET